MVNPASPASNPVAPIAGPRQRAWFRALDRARLTGAKPTYLPRTDSYKVTSPRAGDTYRIHPTEVDGCLTYHCDCAAGMAGRVCWHAALVAALPGECARRREHNARAREGRALGASTLVAGIAPSLADLFA